MIPRTLFILAIMVPLHTIQSMSSDIRAPHEAASNIILSSEDGLCRLDITAPERTRWRKEFTFAYHDRFVALGVLRERNSINEIDMANICDHHDDIFYAAVSSHFSLDNLKQASI